MSRPRVSVFMGTSLDGFIAGPGGSLAFLEPFEKSGEDYGFTAFFETVDGLVIEPLQTRADRPLGHPGVEPSTRRHLGGEFT